MKTRALKDYAKSLMTGNAILSGNIEKVVLYTADDISKLTHQVAVDLMKFLDNSIEKVNKKNNSLEQTPAKQELSQKFNKPSR